MKLPHLLLVVAIFAVFAGCSSMQDPPTDESELLHGSDPVHLTDANFQQEVLESELPVLVDMWAPWCQPCIAMKPTISELAFELSGLVKVAELNIDENPLVKEKYGVNRYPMLLIFRGGVEVDRLLGLKSKDDIVSALRALIGTNIVHPE